MATPWLNRIRLILAIPVSFFVCLFVLYLGTLLGIEILGFLEDKYCPDGPYGGTCTGPSWRTYSIEIYLALITGISAALTVFVSSTLAPTHKRLMRVLVLVIGASVATVIGLQEDSFLLSWISAVLFGAIAVWMMEWPRGGARDRIRFP